MKRKTVIRFERTLFWLAAAMGTIAVWTFGGAMLRRLVFHAMPLPFAAALFALLAAAVAWSFFLIDYHHYHAKDGR